MVQKRQHCIQVKILYQSDKRAFYNKFCPYFFLNDFILFYCYTIFHMFLSPLNILSTCFRWKMATLHSGWNSWPVGTSGIFVQNLQDFFFFQNNFPFYSWTTKYAICKFLCKNANIVFRSKFFTYRTKGHFRTNFARVFLFILFCCYTIFHLFLSPLNTQSTSFHRSYLF